MQYEKHDLNSTLQTRNFKICFMERQINITIDNTRKDIAQDSTCPKSISETLVINFIYAQP